MQPLKSGPRRGYLACCGPTAKAVTQLANILESLFSFSLPGAWRLLRLDWECQWTLQFLVVECCFTSTETVGLLETGAQDGHLDFHTAPEFAFAWLSVALRPQKP